jgi:uncharacterized membrane protein (UPF0127 family)
MTTQTHHPTRSIRPASGLLLLMVAAALTISGCSPAPDTDVTMPDSVAENDPITEAAQVQKPTAVLPDGFPVTLELAITPDELAQGLMFRPRLPDDRGMLLVFSEERLPNIWMMNTLVALDLVYLDRAGRVVDLITDAQPCPGEPCPRFTPKQPAQAVLELPAGSAVRHEIGEGTTIEFTGVPGFPVAEPASD